MSLEIRAASRQMVHGLRHWFEIRTRLLCFNGSSANRLSTARHNGFDHLS